MNRSPSVPALLYQPPSAEFDPAPLWENLHERDRHSAAGRRHRIDGTRAGAGAGTPGSAPGRP